MSSNITELNVAELVSRASRADYFPLSSAQQRLWFMDKLVPDVPLYHVPIVIRFPAEVQSDLLRQAIADVVDRHEILRTTFELVGTSPKQHINEALPTELEVVDLQSVAPQVRAATWIHEASKVLQRPFNLQKGPLLRSVLYQLAEDDNTLFSVMHHIVCDAWSVSIFARELKACYEARVAGELPRLPKLPIQYADFANLQQESIERAEMGNSIAYWRRHLADLPLSALPGSPIRPSHPSFQGGSHSFRVPGNVLAGLRAISKREGATLFMTVLSAFQAFLSRHSGETDIVVGAPVAGRSRVDIEPLIGCFVNPLVLRCDLSGDPFFSALLRNVKDVCVSAYAHQDVPFERLVDELQPDRKSIRNPLFQVAFSLGSSDEPAGQSDESASGLSAGTAKFDLFFACTDTGESLNCILEYDNDLFEPDDIARFATGITNLLTTIAARPARRLSDLMPLSAEERQLLAAWNTTPMARPEQSFTEQFEAACVKHAERVAIVVGATHVTYAELFQRCARLAQALQDAGVGAGDRVGILCRRSSEFVAAIIGTMMASAAYVPIDPDYPDGRIRSMLDEIPGAALLAERSALDVAGRLERSCICIEDEQHMERSIAVRAPKNAPNDLAYAIFTSGSTGKPKLAAVRHGGLSNLLHWYLSEFDLSEKDRVLVVTSPSFDLTQKNFLAPLLKGAEVHLAPAHEFDPRQVTRTIKAEKISILNCTPSLFYALLDAVRDGEAFAPLRFVFLGGEPINARRLLALSTETAFAGQVVNTYGPTECSDVVAYHRIEDVEAYVDRRMPVGRPIHNVQLFILDEKLRDVPLGAPGEICITGVAVGAGYLNDEVLTESLFRRRPGSAGTDVLYRTGDRARFLPDGNIEFLGRIDTQIKLRGFRFELGEIETAFSAHSAVSETAVVAVETRTGDARLAAFVVPKADAAPTVAAFLRMRRSGTLDGHSTFELPNGMLIVHQNRRETEFLYRELFEERVYFNHGIGLPPKATVFDVGANIGLFGLSLTRRVAAPTVYAFEPIPPIFEALRINMEAYGVDAKLFNVGISDRAGAAEFSYYPHASILSGQFADPAKEGETVGRFLRKQAEIGDAPVLPEERLAELVSERLVAQTYPSRTMTISDVIRGHDVSHIDLLKIDVEKGEYPVLLGIESEHWGLIDQIVIEVHDTGDTLNRIRSLLSEHGFSVVVDQDELLKTSGMFSVYAQRGAPGTYVESAPITAEDSDRMRRWESIDVLREELRQWVSQRLPNYMIPASIVLLDRMPQTPSGKLDTKALCALDEHSSIGRADLTPPRSEVEGVVAAIWEEVLETRPIGVFSNFFDDVGGDSLSATQVIVRLSDKLNKDVPLRLLFERPTISGLAEACANLASSEDESLSQESAGHP
jgi:amino acid adenylation domain-containing protein/FkbM family methyltransferase